MTSAGKGTDEAFSDALKQVVAESPADVRESFLRAVASPADELDTELWGSSSALVDRQAAALENLRREFCSRQALLATALTRTEAAELLEVSPQAVLDRLRAGDLVGVRKGREWRLPTWQFDADLADGVVPGLRALSAVFSGGVVSLSAWVLTPNVDLDGAAPMVALARGRVADVVRAARSTTAAAV